MKEGKLEMEYVPIDSITPYEGNPRLNSEAVPILAKSINDFGFLVPIVVDKDNVIAAGHTRYLASLELGLKEVPVIRATDLSPKQIKAFRLADNKVAELAGWDFDLLDLELADLGDDFDMEDYGFILEDLDSITGDEEYLGEEEISVADPVPRERPQPLFDDNFDIREGDLITLGRHRLYCGTLEDEGAVEALLGGGEVRLAYSEPENPSMIRGSLGLSLSFTDDVMYVYPLKEQHKAAFCALLGEHVGEFKTMMYRQRPQDLKSPNRFIPAVDPVLVFSLKDTTDVFGHDPGPWGGLAQCKDPWSSETAKDFIEHFTDVGDGVLDPHAGMGYTMLACEDLGRTCYMAEASPVDCAGMISAYKERTGDKGDISVKHVGGEEQFL